MSLVETEHVLIEFKAKIRFQVTETAGRSGAELGECVVYSAHRGGCGGQSRQELCYTPREKGPKEDALTLRCFQGVRSRSREAIFSPDEASVRQIPAGVRFWYLHFKKDIEIGEKVKKGTLKII